MEKVLSPDNMWYAISNTNEIISPSLLVYPDRIEKNIQKMIEIAGGVDRIRPHVKTHKMSEIIKLQMKYGIYKFKTATISETEMVATCGAKDILLAIQPVGPNIKRFFQLKQKFPELNISCVADSEEVITQLSLKAQESEIQTSVWLDINNGMNRTGVTPGKEAIRLYKLINNLPMLNPEGLHVYDGHIHEKDIQLRKKISDQSYASVAAIIEELTRNNINNVKIVAGGTPTFPIHALRKNVELSPGTLLLWDYGYSSSFADLDFLHAAVLFMRVISRPEKDLICLDLGHKAVASEMPQPRVIIFGLNNYSVIGHNEEHMVIRTTEADKFKTGDELYGIPWHICPTVDRHENVTVVRNQIASGQWKIDARIRMISI